MDSTPASDHRDLPETLEPAVRNWYRQALASAIAGCEDASAVEELRTGIEAALSRAQRPPEDSCRLLQRLGREAATRTDDGGPERLGIKGILRSIHRRVLGRPPHLETRRTSGVDGTRVLHAIDSLGIGGAQQLIVDLACSAPIGADHLVACRTLAASMQPGVPCARTDAVAADRLMDRFRPRLLHVCHYHAGPATTVWYHAIVESASRRGIPIVQSHCVIGEPLFHRGIEHLVFCSEWSRARSCVAGIPDSVIHPGSPLERFAAERRPLRERPVVGMVYRLAGDKIDASTGKVLVAILERCPRASIEIVGDGSVRDALAAELDREGLRDRVTWHGFVPFDRLPELHRRFDLEIAPVVADTFGSGSVHAIAAGTPVIGYGVSALPSILRHPQAIAAPGSPDALAEQVAAVLGDERLHAEIHETQWRHARTSYDLDGMNRRYHALFASIAGSPGKEPDQRRSRAPASTGRRSITSG